MRRLDAHNRWMVGAEVPQTSIFFMSVATRYILQEWPRLGLGTRIRKYFSYFDGDDCKMYFIRREFDAGSDFLARKMFQNPRWALKLVEKIEQWSRKLMAASKKVLKSRLSELTDAQLVKLYTHCLEYHSLQNGVGPSVSWLADAEKERFTKGLWKRLDNHLQAIGSPHAIVDVFSFLTTPRKDSFVAREEHDFLAIAVLLHRKPRVRKIFRSSTGSTILKKLRLADAQLYQRIRRHHAKYCWLAYQYRGPATPIEGYLGRWRETLKGRINPQKLLDKLVHDRKDLLAYQRRLVRQLKLPSDLTRLLFLAQRMVFIKGFRKEAIYHGMYAYDPLFREMGKRLGLTISQLWAMKAQEIVPALLKREFRADELNERQKVAVEFIDRTHDTILTGKEAKVFLKNITFEKAHSKAVKELRGTPACPGRVVGIVRIVNIPQEMQKMKSGDIMVAHNTNPNLVPAMRKAGALISEAGGLTCHTAIVARELRIPCIVGVPGADKALKDGDKVEVNANQGIVRRIK
ncbi:MAG: PEP-utilizing enzyme [Parcubacteria group bacterium]